MLPATGVIFPEEEPNDCCNFDIYVDGRTTPGVCGHGYVPLSKYGARHSENWTNNNKDNAFEKSQLLVMLLSVFLKYAGLIE